MHTFIGRHLYERIRTFSPGSHNKNIFNSGFLNSDVVGKEDDPFFILNYWNFFKPHTLIFKGYLESEYQHTVVSLYFYTRERNL